MVTMEAPMYEDSHESCSVLLGRIRNDHLLIAMPERDQFRWLHRFYLVLDRIVEQHKCYKLHGGAHGFLISTAVAEPDPEHAATLLRFALHVHAAAQRICLPSRVPVDLSLALASGPSSSGLLGSLSLTYQIVGRLMREAKLLSDTQAEVPVSIAGSMVKRLHADAAKGLSHLGSLPLTPGSSSNEEVDVYTVQRYAHMALTQPL